MKKVGNVREIFFVDPITVKPHIIGIIQNFRHESLFFLLNAVRRLDASNFFGRGNGCGCIEQCQRIWAMFYGIKICRVNF